MQAHAASTGRPLRPGAVAAQARHLVPALATIGGGERQNRGPKTIVYGDNDRPIWLHDRLSADDAGIVRGRLCWAPRQSTVGGGTHLDKVELAGVVELGIAVPVVGAAGRIIADGPVLVVKITTGIHHHSRSPRQSPIRRATDIHIDRTGGSLNAKPGDQPDVVLGIEGHRGIAGTGIRSRRC